MKKNVNLLIISSLFFVLTSCYTKVLLPTSTSVAERDEEYIERPVRTHIYYVDDLYAPWNFYYGAPWWYDDYYDVDRYNTYRSRKSRINPSKRDASMDSSKSSESSRIKSSTRDDDSDSTNNSTEFDSSKKDEEQKTIKSDRIVPKKR